MHIRRRQLFIAIGSTVLVFTVVVLVMGGILWADRYYNFGFLPHARPSPTPTPTLTIGVSDAIEAAIMHARPVLKGDIAASRADLMDIYHYHQRIGVEDPEPRRWRPVWVVSLRGDLDWSLRPSGGNPIELLVVVVDARTGFSVDMRPYQKAKDSPFPIP